MCTSNPDELAWFMGLEVKDLQTGVKPDDLELIECSEEWSHNGVPQWACKEEKEKIDEDGCEMVGETADEVWFACSEASKEGARVMHRTYGIQRSEPSRSTARLCILRWQALTASNALRRILASVVGLASCRRTARSFASSRNRGPRRSRDRRRSFGPRPQQCLFIQRPTSGVSVQFATAARLDQQLPPGAVVEARSLIAPAGRVGT